MNAPTVAADPIVIRASSLTYWPDCERRGAARLFKSIVEGRGFLLRTTPIHVGAPIGTATHAGAAYGLQTKIDTGELSSLSEARDVSMAALDEALVRDGEIDWKPREAANVDQAQKQVTRMLAMVHTRVSPTIWPAAVEDRLKADIGDGFVLSGQRDIYGIETLASGGAYYDPKADDGWWKIKDLKTGAHPGPHGPQTGAYGILARTHGYRVDGADIIQIPRVTLNKPQPEPIIIKVPIESAERAAESTYKRAKSSLIEFMKTGDPHVFLANPASIMCSDRCPAWGTSFCREHLEIE